MTKLANWQESDGASVTNSSTYTTYANSSFPSNKNNRKFLLRYPHNQRVILFINVYFFIYNI